MDDITDEVIEAYNNYLELCDLDGGEFCMVGFGEFILESYNL